MRDIGKNIRELRESKKLTQDQLAERLFVTRQTVSNYETGRTRPDVDMIMRIAQVLDTDANSVFYGMPEAQSRRRELAKTAVTVGLLVVLAAVLFAAYHWASIQKTIAFAVWPMMLCICVLRPLVMLLFGWSVMQVLSVLFGIKQFVGKRARIVRIVMAVVLAAAFVLMILLVICSTGPNAPDFMSAAVLNWLANGVYWLCTFAGSSIYLVLGAVLWAVCPNNKDENALSPEQKCK